MAEDLGTTFANMKPMDPELARLLEQAKALPPMTPIERAIQRRSWVRGEMGMSDPQRSAEEIDAALATIPEFALLDRIQALEKQLSDKKDAMERMSAVCFKRGEERETAEQALAAALKRLETVAEIATRSTMAFNGYYDEMVSRGNRLGRIATIASAHPK